MMQKGFCDKTDGHLRFLPPRPVTVDVFILPASVLNEKLGDQKNLSLSSLKKLNPMRAGFDYLKEKIDRANI